MTQLELVDGLVRGGAFLDPLAGRRVTIVGFAGETGAAARTLRAAGAEVRIEPVTTRADLTRDALVVVTVASALRARPVGSARAAGVPVRSELDLAWCATEADAFAIAGGPQAALTARLARSLVADHAAVMLAEPTVDQLAAMQVFRPRVAVILRDAEPLAARLVAQQTRRDCLVLCEDDPGARAVARAGRGHVLWLSATRAIDHGVYVARGRIAARLNGHVEEICPVPGIPRDELEPALAAVACALWTGLDPDAIGAALVRQLALDAAALQSLRRARFPSLTPISMKPVLFSGARTLLGQPTHGSSEQAAPATTGAR